MQCPECFLKFANEGNLANHLKHTHAKYTNSYFLTKNVLQNFHPFHPRPSFSEKKWVRGGVMGGTYLYVNLQNAVVDEF